MKNITIGGIIIVAVIVFGIFLSRMQGTTSTGPGVLDGFATCLADSGSKFYGAFWCPHCQAQKALFKTSAKYLPYVECSTLDGKNQTQVCKDANIISYPTWEFADGSRMTGETSLVSLAGKTSCVLPEGVDATEATSTASSTAASEVGA